MSASLFFYGTLCHIPLLELVLARARAEIDLQEAVLSDHAVSWVQDHPFPMIAHRAGAAAQGILVQSLSARDVERLRFYEGGFEYDLSRVTVMGETGAFAADVFFPDEGVWCAGADWSLQDWVDQWGEISMTAAREVMAQFSKRTADEMAHLLPFFRARGWARHMAKVGAPTRLRRDTQSREVKVNMRQGSAAGFFRLDYFDVSYPRFDGVQSEVISRSAFVAYDAALVLPYDPKYDLVMLIEQMRYGPLLRGDPLPWVLEPIAGLVDAGEAPIETARREAVEEAGLALEDIRPMMKVYPSPGYSTEFFHCFLGLCALDPTNEGLHGLENEHEDIRTHVIPFSRAMDLLDSGEINEGPTAMMLLWLARNRESLRSPA